MSVLYQKILNYTFLNHLDTFLNHLDTNVVVANVVVERVPFCLYFKQFSFNHVKDLKLF